MGSSIDGLRRQIERLAEQMPPAPAQPAAIGERSIDLSALTDEQLEVLHEHLLHKQEEGADPVISDAWLQAWLAGEVRPALTTEELLASFFAIDITAVPDEQLAAYPVSRVGYNNLLVNHIQRGRMDHSTREDLKCWYHWRREQLARVAS